MSVTAPFDQTFQLTQTSLHGTRNYVIFAATVNHGRACVDTFAKAVELQGGTKLAADAAVQAHIDTLKPATVTFAEWHITLVCTRPRTYSNSVTLMRFVNLLP